MTQMTQGYVATFSEKLAARYRACVHRQDPALAKRLDERLALQSLTDKNARMAAYIAFWNTLPEDMQYALAAADAKLSQLARIARTMATTAIVQAHNAIRAETAGSIDYVLERFRKQGVSAADCQKFIDENAQAWLSLTGHPTNPTTVAHVEAQTAVAQALASGAGADGLDSALLRLYKTDIVGNPKSPLDEARETLNTLNVLYDTALPLKRLFEQALEKHGYAAQGVRIEKPLVHPCAWTLGDGDGNPSMTAEVLEEGVSLHRAYIRARYTQTLHAIAQSLPDEESAAVQFLSALADRPAEISKTQTDHAKSLCKTDAGKQATEDFRFLFSCFGSGFGTIDVRHNAQDIMATLQHAAHIAEIKNAEHIFAADPDAQAAEIAIWLKDQGTLQKLSALTPQHMAAHETAARIYGRMQVMARHPDMFEKLIIAETTHPAQALAALLLLKATGNTVGSPASRLDLVPLSESVADLQGLGRLLTALLDDETFRAHVACRRTLLVMIAKSDTTRQDGRGEAEYAQYKASVDAYAALAAQQVRYPALSGVRMSIKNGGGHALQRGGGRVTEIPALHGRAAADAGVNNIGPSTLTIQGQQMLILFCPGKTALGTLEALAAQNLYTRAGVAGLMPAPTTEEGIDKDLAAADARRYAEAAGAGFDAWTKKTNIIDDLLTGAPWLAMKAGNASSRPAKRGERPVIPGITPHEAKGDNPKALQGRAISGERLTAHACLPVFSVLGLREALQAVESRAEGALHHLYRAHKIYRDAARATLSVLTMADFDIAWPLLAGQPRPTPEQRAQLTAKFDLAHRSVKAETLAYLEDYFLDVEKLTFLMITGRAAPESLRHGSALSLLWPDLGAQVAQRDREAEWARVIECYRTCEMDKKPDEPVALLPFRITQALYTAANAVNTPIGILATRTRLEPVFQGHNADAYVQPESFLEETVKNALVLPRALSDNGIF